MDILQGRDRPPSYKDQTKNQRDIQTQIVVSIALGLFAFLTFCVLRPRWITLYAARKQQKNAASILPELPATLFGWLPVLWKITDAEVLASAGLDAYVFLAFFRLAIKFILVAFFFQLVIMLPVHHRDTGNWGLPNVIPGGNSSTLAWGSSNPWPALILSDYKDSSKHEKPEVEASNRMLWLYVFFVYLYSALALCLIVRETKRIIRIRQDYMGSQTTVTDRTIRLSGIPAELRSEDLIKETIENLDIGKVENVLLCRDWTEVDNLWCKRNALLRRLEESWARYEKNKEEMIIDASHSGVQNGTEESAVQGDEETGFVGSNNTSRSNCQHLDRPLTRIWYGKFKLQTRQVDAIEHYEEQLNHIDELLKASRKKIFRPTPLALVTLDSIATAQMTVQALMDPEPMKLVANLAPAPADVVWQNTYLSRSNRMLRSWTITLVIAVLTIFWSIILLPLAGLLSLENIGKISPRLQQALNSHQVSRALIQTGLPTLIFSLLALAVPYLYYWLSTLQGMMSQGDIEMSLISKNFFFSFFNLFLVFTIFGAASTVAGYYKQIGDTLKDTTSIAFLLARSLKNLVLFYMNLIILQGLGLFPFRLLEFGSVALYPIWRARSTTPRDHAELVQPPVFSYGFYLPQTILIFIICIVYSVLPGSWFILFFGLLYFCIGAFIYKYQLLYAMDHRQHSTGKAWPIICNRVVLGLLTFQLAMAGILGLSHAFQRAALIVPLLAFTVWFIYFYQKTYEPLMKFIAIRSLTHQPPFGAFEPGESQFDSESSNGRARGRDIDEDETASARYINPSLVRPLEGLWLNGKPRDPGISSDDENQHPTEPYQDHPAPPLPLAGEADIWRGPNSS